jgi:hypothetical protein
VYSRIPGCGAGLIQSRDQKVPCLTSRTLDFSGSDSNAITKPITAYPQFEYNLYPGMKVNDSPAAEIFAQQYAIYLGFPDTVDNQGNPRNGSDAAYGTVGNVTASAGLFGCSNFQTRTLTNLGRSATTKELSGTGYSSPAGPIQSGVNAGYYGPYSNNTSCSGTTNTGNYSFGS